jgi:hypothetical protein
MSVSDKKPTASSGATEITEKAFRGIKLKACWQISRDPRLGRAEVCIAQYLINAVKQKYGNALASYDGLAEWANADRRTVGRAVAKLDRLGLIRRESGQWKQHEANKYWPIWEALCAPKDNSSRDVDVPSDFPSRDVDVPLVRTPTSPTVGTWTSPPISISRTEEYERDRDIASHAAGAAAPGGAAPGGEEGGRKAVIGFEEIWRVHHHGDKNWAKKAFNTALANGHAGEDILAGLVKYLEATEGKRQDYLAKWLANEGWRNPCYGDKPKKAAAAAAADGKKMPRAILGNGDDLVRCVQERPDGLPDFIQIGAVLSSKQEFLDRKPLTVVGYLKGRTDYVMVESQSNYSEISGSKKAHDWAEVWGLRTPADAPAGYAYDDNGNKTWKVGKQNRPDGLPAFIQLGAEIWFLGAEPSRVIGFDKGASDNVLVTWLDPEPDEDEPLPCWESAKNFLESEHQPKRAPVVNDAVDFG